MTGPPPSPAAEAQRLRHSKRTIFRAGALTVFALSAFSWLTPERAPLLISLHALWALHLLIIGELVGRGRLPVRSAGVVSSAGGVLLLPAILAMTSEATHGVLYPTLVAMPLMVAALAPDDRPAVLVFAVGGLAWIVALALIDHQPTWRVVASGSVAAACSVVAVLATLAWERAKAAEQRANAERLAALERLAESEQARLRAERVSLMGQVSTGLAHEMNNPLSYVSSNFHFVREQLEERRLLDPELAEALRDTAQGLERIAQLVKEMQRFSYRNEGPAEHGHCEEALEAALERAGNRLSVFSAIEKQVSPTCPRVALTQPRLIDVLHHLLANAAEAATGDGVARSDVRLWLTVGAGAQPAQVKILVEDSGPGLSAATQARLFEPFFTTRPAGVASGLGLALCREYVERAGGSIGGENRAGGGARFVILLPAASS